MIRTVLTVVAIVVAALAGYTIGVYVAACEFRADRYSLRYSDAEVDR